MLQQHNRRSVASLCLIAFLMLIAISTVHTHICYNQKLPTNVPSIGSLEWTEADHCIACELLLNGFGFVIIAAVILFAFGAPAKWTLQSTASVVPGTVIVSSSPRAPPTI